MRRTIVQITPYYPPHLGGLERVVEHLAHQLGQRHDVRVITTALGADGRPRRYGAGRVTIRRHRAIEIAHTALSPGLPISLAVRAPRDAVLHLHCAHAFMPELVALTARLRGQRFILHFHFDVDPSGRFGRLLPAYKKHVFGRSMRAAAGVIVLTEEQGAFVRDTYGVRADRVFVVPNGVGANYFMPVRQTVRRPLRLLYVGRLSAQKNVARLLEAAALLREPVQLRIVGDGELREKLEAYAAELGLSNVEFSGGLLGEDLVRAYADADAFVLPSDREGMPLVVLEAMAAALPVIATDVPGTAELLDGVGLLAAPDPAALAAAVDSVAADPGLRLRLARQSAATAPDYSWETVAAQVEQVYAQVYPEDAV
ncbi:glycosyltransferase family 4 protein [Streptomyces sp. NPDC046977]|uniref:glycosyltransferase family 4 protein n=1 Tax=Streptomyces sp. NPDC046977 TaxID=3154703 RepID=UPI0033E689AF